MSGRGQSTGLAFGIIALPEAQRRSHGQLDSASIVNPIFRGYSLSVGRTPIRRSPLVLFSRSASIGCFTFERRTQ